MTEPDAFLEAICAHPDDDTPRLIYADWLEEHGQQERAEFIRVQCKLEQRGYRCLKRPRATRNAVPLSLCCIVCDLRRREKELRSSLDWTAIFRREFPVLFEMTHYIDTDNPAVEWRRGFIAEITLTCADWPQHREALLKAAPLEKVTLTHLRLLDIVGRNKMGIICPWPERPQSSMECDVVAGQLQQHGIPITFMSEGEAAILYGNPAAADSLSGL